MAWFCSGYFPRRFVLATIKGPVIDKRLAKVWKPRGPGWQWITLLNTWGKAPSASLAMKAAEESLDRAGRR